MTAQQIAALAAELTNDPNGYGYSVPLGLGQLQVVADLFNEVRGAIVLRRGNVTGAVIIGALSVTEFEALTQIQLTRLMVVCSATGGVDTSADGTRAILAALFPVGASRTALIALADRTASRAEALFGASVTVNDVARALGRG